MPTRCIKLKLVVPRRGDRPEAKDIWTTHAVVNDAVSNIEQILLLCRGRGYTLPDGDRISAESVQQKALQYAREVQAKNGKPGEGTDDEILALLRRLYEEIVPSCLLDDSGKPQSGNAQQSRGLVGPLMNPASKGFQAVFEEIVDPLPDWVALWEDGREEATAQSEAWLASKTGQEFLNKQRQGRSTGWVKAAKKSEPWQKKFVEDQKKKSKESAGIAGVFGQMRDRGVLPLMEPPIRSRLATGGALSDWDYLAVRLAVGHLLSWESWNHRAANEHAEITKCVEQQRIIVSACGITVGAIRDYEKQRHEELKKITMATDDRPFLIGVRTIRAWDRVRERWLAANVRTTADRKKVLAELQTEMRGRFGDPHLFGWLANEAQVPIWQDADPLPEVARLNALERLLARKKDQAVCTVADARVHPRWAQYGAKGDGNLKNYELELSEDRRYVELTLPLLCQRDGQLQELPHKFRIASSGQFESPKFGDERKSPTVIFGPLENRFTATLGSADVFLSRRRIEDATATRLAEGEIGPVWLKLALDVQSQAPADRLDGRGKLKSNPAQFHFQSAWGKKSKSMTQVEAGFRVLSVDLGLRSFASCSVFELVDKPPKNGLFFEITEPTGMWAKHERSFLLTLPGETPRPEHLKARRSVRDELRSLGRDVSCLGNLLRLSIETDPATRRTAIESWILRATDPQNSGQPELLDRVEMDALLESSDTPIEQWSARVGDLHRACERKLGQRIGQWRKQTRSRAWRSYRGGKSAWAIEYLSDVRRLLQRWSRHARHQGEIRRADRKKGGVFAAKLLDHINALKEDRIKTGADLIVQAARGHRPGECKGWVKQYEPCHLILFENLARYRFRVDRPRFENSQLMKWAHRQITAQTEMQAEVYGVTVSDTSAGFSSRLHARSGAPGVRVRTVTSEDLDTPFMRQRIEQALDGIGVSIDKLHPGDQIPWQGGETFVTLGARNTTGDGETCAIHADVNAAQNLQRRFWTRHADAYRLTTVEIHDAAGDVAAYVPSPVGERTAGALRCLTGKAGKCCLVAAEDGDGFVLKAASGKVGTVPGSAKTAKNDDEISEIDSEIEEALGDLARTGGRETFFRDPTGTVLRPDRWYSQKEFWGRVRQRIGCALLDHHRKSPF